MSKPNDSGEPVRPCIHHDDIQHEFREIKSSVARIEAAIVGDERVGHRGIVARLNIIERVTLAIIAGLFILGGEKLIRIFF